MLLQAEVATAFDALYARDDAREESRRAIEIAHANEARSILHTGPRTTPFARRAPSLEDFTSRRSSLSAHHSSLLSIPTTHRDAFQLRF